MSDWIELKINYTSNDYLNFEDMNNAENDIQFIADVVSSYDKLPQLGEIVTDRIMHTIDFAEDFNRVENNIAKLMGQIHKPIGWITPNTSWQAEDDFSYVDVNRITIDITLLYEMAINTKNYLQYCGTFNCGQNNTYL